MKIWETLVGVRDDLPSLREKWWHKVSIVFWFFTAVIVFLVAAVLLSDPIRPTRENIFSLSLLTFAKGRPGQLTLLTELSALPGSIGILAGDGEPVPLTLAPLPENIRCAFPARFKARQTVLEKDSKMGATISFRAIPDYVGQSDDEPRHCAASRAYESLIGQQVISYRLNNAFRRRRSGGTAAKALVVSIIWLVLALNFYYRGIITVYAARRKRRIRNPAHSR